MAADWDTAEGYSCFVLKEEQALSELSTELPIGEPPIREPQINRPPIKYQGSLGWKGWFTGTMGFLLTIPFTLAGLGIVGLCLVMFPIGILGLPFAIGFFIPIFLWITWAWGQKK